MAMKIFENPIIEIEKFEVADIITASGDSNDQWDAGLEGVNWFLDFSGRKIPPGTNRKPARMCTAHSGFFFTEKGIRNIAQTEQIGIVQDKQFWLFT